MLELESKKKRAWQRWSVVAGAILAASALSACNSDQGSDGGEEAGSEGSEEASHVRTVHNVNGVDVVVERADEEQASDRHQELEEASELGDGAEIQAQNCVYIEWCNRPNSTEGTVGRTRNTGTCRAQCNAGAAAIFNEFFADADFACGALTPQVILKCF